MNHHDAFGAIRDAALSALTERMRAVRYLVVGANDGTRGDPLFAHTGDPKWHGMLFEPLPAPFEGLRKSYAGRPGAVLRNQAVVADSPGGKRTFFNVPFSTTNSSFRRDVILKHKVYPGFEKVEEQLVEVDVDCVSLDELIAEPGFAPPDVLLTDTEGYDFKLFEVWWARGWRPAFVEIEVIHLQQSDMMQVLERMAPAGYDLFWFGTDVFGLRRDAFPERELRIFRLLRDQTVALQQLDGQLRQALAVQPKA
jgi:FkbM family methyltransferase